MSSPGSLFKLELGELSLRGVAAGGVETCLIVKELGVVFDIGRCPLDALPMGILLATHGHADHLAGVHYYASQRSLMRLAPPQIHFPAEIEADLRTIFECWSRIEDYPIPVELRPNRPGDVIDIGRRELSVLALASAHRVPSRAYLVRKHHQRLRPEYEGLSGPELGRLKAEGHVVTRLEHEPLLCVTGDTQIELFQREPEVRRAKILVHEVTSWDDRRDRAETRRWGHTHVDDMVAHAEAFEGRYLVLVHRSMRHSKAQVERIVHERFPAAVRDRVLVFGP